MATQQHLDNLGRMTRDLESRAVSRNFAADPAMSGECKKMAYDAPLVHSTPFHKLGGIIASGFIVSPHVLRPNADCVEKRLGTWDCVFLYACSFRYPDTECGFLFGPPVEADESQWSGATPFDSGGLEKVFRPQDTPAQRREFLQRHELPVPQYRQYLETTLSLCFADPWHYFDETLPRLEAPIELDGGDARRRTFEVRAKTRLNILGHLEAFFIAQRRLLSAPALQKFAAAVEAAGGRVIRWTTNGTGPSAFEQMRLECLRYLMQRFKDAR